MPIETGKDKFGKYYRWGSHGKKYRGRGARAKALEQARAAYARGYRGK